MPGVAQDDFQVEESTVHCFSLQREIVRRRLGNVRRRLAEVWPWTKEVASRLRHDRLLP